MLSRRKNSDQNWFTFGRTAASAGSDNNNIEHRSTQQGAAATPPLSTPPNPVITTSSSAISVDTKGLSEQRGILFDEVSRLRAGTSADSKKVPSSLYIDTLLRRAAVLGDGDSTLGILRHIAESKGVVPLPSPQATALALASCFNENSLNSVATLTAAASDPEHKGDPKQQQLATAIDLLPATLLRSSLTVLAAAADDSESDTASNNNSIGRSSASSSSSNNNSNSSGSSSILRHFPAVAAAALSTGATNDGAIVLSGLVHAVQAGWRDAPELMIRLLSAAIMTGAVPNVAQARHLLLGGVITSVAVRQGHLGNALASMLAVDTRLDDNAIHGVLSLYASAYGPHGLLPPRSDLNALSRLLDSRPPLDWQQQQQQQQQQQPHSNSYAISLAATAYAELGRHRALHHSLEAASRYSAVLLPEAQVIVIQSLLTASSGAAITDVLKRHGAVLGAPTIAGTEALLSACETTPDATGALEVLAWAAGLNNVPPSRQRDWNSRAVLLHSSGRAKTSTSSRNTSATNTVTDSITTTANSAHLKSHGSSVSTAFATVTGHALDAAELLAATNQSHAGSPPLNGIALAHVYSHCLATRDAVLATSFYGWARGLALDRAEAVAFVAGTLRGVVLSDIDATALAARAADDLRAALFFSSEAGLAPLEASEAAKSLALAAFCVGGGVGGGGGRGGANVDENVGSAVVLNGAGRGGVGGGNSGITAEGWAPVLALDTGDIKGDDGMKADLSSAVTPSRRCTPKMATGAASAAGRVLADMAVHLPDHDPRLAIAVSNLPWSESCEGLDPDVVATAACDAMRPRASFTALVRVHEYLCRAAVLSSATHSKFVAAIGNTRDMDALVCVFKMLRRQNLQPTRQDYAQMLKLQARNGWLRGAKGTLSQMRGAGHVPTTVAFNHVLAAINSREDLEMGMRLYEQMCQDEERDGVTTTSAAPDRVTYCTLAAKCVRYGAKERVDGIFADMADAGIRFNAVALTTWLSTVGRGPHVGRDGGVGALLRIADMALASGTKSGTSAVAGATTQTGRLAGRLDAKFYAEFLRTAARLVRTSDAELYAFGDERVEKEEGLGLASGGGTSSTPPTGVGLSSVRQPKILEKLRRAILAAKSQAAAEGVRLRPTSWAHALEVMAACAAPGAASDLLEEMRDSNVNVNAACARAIVHAYGSVGDLMGMRQAYNALWHTDGVQPDMSVITAMIYYYGMARDIDSAMEIYDDMLALDLRPTKELNFVLIHACRIDPISVLENADVS